MMNKKMRNDSKYLSYILRHHPEEVGCTIDCYGWVDVDKIVQNTRLTFEYLKEIVESDTRYTFSSDYKKIRAYHGHSIQGIMYLDEVIPPHYLYHGTSEKNVLKIKESGYIKGMSRVMVHLSQTKEKAREIGLRHGKPVVLVIDCLSMMQNGYVFYDSQDGVYLTNDIPIQYIVEDNV